MGFDKGEKRTKPPPWGWPPRRKEKAHDVGEIVYHGAVKPTRHTKDRRHEQEKACHKTRSGSAPHGQAARDAGHGMEPVRQQVRSDIAAALRKGPQHPIRHLAAGVQARGGVADRQARQPLDLPGVRHRQGKSLHKRGQVQHGGVGEGRASQRTRRGRSPAGGSSGTGRGRRPRRRGPTPPTRKAPSRTATASSGDGTRKAQTSTS